MPLHLKLGNAGNLVTDIMVAALNADCALLNSGTLRSDARHPVGKFLLRVRLGKFLLRVWNP